MSLFERSYRAAAKTELERNLMEIEEQKSQKEAAEQEAAAITFDSNVTFAQKCGLISAQEAVKYRKRLEAVRNHEELARTQTEEIVDGYCNPYEQGVERFTMEEAQAYVNREAAAEKAKESGHEGRQKPSRDEPERTQPY